MSAYSPCSLLCGATSTCRDCRALHAIDEDVQKAEEVTRKAKTERSRLLASFNSNRDRLTTRMPVEVVCCIFEEYVKMHVVTEKDLAAARPVSFGQQPIHRKGPLSLGAVCMKWRKIAWAHPPLWKSLVIPLACPSNHLGPTMVAEWLNRTGMQMMDIQMHMYHMSYRGELDADMANEARAMEFGRTVVKELNRVSARWRSLDFSECPSAVLTDLDNTGSTAASVLHDLTLGSLSDQRRYSPVTLFKMSKHQHHPKLLALLSPLLISRLNVGFARLTTLHLQEMSHLHCLRFLRSVADLAPVLLQLSIRLMDEDRDLDSNVEIQNPIQFPSAKFLTIYEEECSPDTTALLFSALKLPALRSLKYIGDGPNFLREPNRFPVAQFREFLERSACSLKTLNLVGPELDDASLEQILGAMPTLRTLRLELRNRNQTGHLFNALSQRDLDDPSTESFLPNLTRLTLTARAPTQWQSFVGIFVQDPSLPVGDAQFAPKPPTRSSLQVTITLKDVSSEIDLQSLHQLVHIWRKYGVSAVFSVSGAGYNYLLDSYHRRLWQLPQNERKAHTHLEKSLTLMSTLKF